VVSITHKFLGNKPWYTLNRWLAGPRTSLDKVVKTAGAEYTSMNSDDIKKYYSTFKFFCGML
jgi:hypothetical protein